MISTNVSTTETVRNVFIIDDKGIIRLILIYPLNVGRCIPEILRALEALQIADCNKAATPANWLPGDPIIIPTPKTFDELEGSIRELEKNKNGISWYLRFKENECKNFEKFENNELN